MSGEKTEPSTLHFNQTSRHERNENVAQSLVRITEMLETLHRPLISFLEQNLLPETHNGHNEASVEQLLATSPLMPFLKDDEITDVLINGPNEIYINKHDKLEKNEYCFSQ